jgi:hypothetical protein
LKSMWKSGELLEHSSNGQIDNVFRQTRQSSELRRVGPGRLPRPITGMAIPGPVTELKSEPGHRWVQSQDVDVRSLESVTATTAFVGLLRVA